MRQPYSRRPPVFLALPASDQAAFHSLGTPATFAARSDVYRQGDPSDHLYRVIEGRVHLLTCSEDGREMIVRAMYPGDLLGLSAVISHVPYEVSASAAIGSRVQAIGTKDFLNFIQSCPQSITCVAKALAEEYLDIVERAQILQLTSTTPARLARVLLECAPCDDPTSPFEFVFTHTEVASMVGCSRESVSRTFGSFQKNRLIEVQGQRVTILRPESLAAFGAV